MTRAKHIFAGAAAAILVAILFSPINAAASDAYLYLRNRVNPLFIHNIKFLYAGQNVPAERAIIFQQGQRSYSSYPFQEIRRISFSNVVSYRNLHPVFSVRVHLMQAAHWVDALLMPVRSISGIQGGRMWEFDVRSEYGMDENAFQVKEIMFVNQN